MMVLVTHHVEEVPAGFTHAMLLRRGRSSPPGPIEDVFTARTLSRCFGVPLEIERRTAAGGPGPHARAAPPGRAGK